MAAIRAFSDVALAQFTTIYDEVIADMGLVGVPSGEKLFEWMSKKIYENDAPMTSSVKKPLEQQPERTEMATPQRPPNAEVKGKLSSKVLKTTQLVVKITTNEDGKEEKETLELPYLPDCIDYSETCCGLKVNGGLYTPCLTRPSKGSESCKICEKQGFKNGTIHSREGVPVTCYSVTTTSTNKEGEEKSTTKKELSYGTYIAKRGLTREFVEKLIADTYGDVIQIPEHYWVADKTKSSRVVKPKAKKSVSASSDESASVESDCVEKPKAKRGRPKKVAQTVEENIESVENNDWMESVSGVEEDAQQTAVEPEPVEEEPVEEKPVKKQPVKKQPVKKQPAKKQPVKKQPEPEPEPVVEEAEEDEDDEGITYFHYNGERYGYDEENTLFKVDEDGDVEIVGTWDPEAKKPIFSED